MIEDCKLYEWEIWPGNALHLDAYWDDDAPSRIFKFRQKIIGAAWPHSLLELERSITTFSIAIHEAIETFLKHSDLDYERKRYKTVKFYRDYYNDPDNKLLDEYNDWVKKCDDYMYEVAKSVNWVAEVVRRDINPSFFATEGKFLLTYLEGLIVGTQLLEYTQEEKELLPQKLIDSVKSNHKILK